MKKKRSVGIRILSLYMIIGGILNFVINGVTPDSVDKIITISFATCSIICAIAVFCLASWGRKSTIIYFICCIIFNCLFFSPILNEQRIQRYENRYNKKLSQYHSKYGINNKNISKEKYLFREISKIERAKKRKFDFPRMLMAILFPVAIIFYLSNPAIKEEFKRKVASTTDNTISNTLTGGV